jgi:hypothetical protein
MWQNNTVDGTDKAFDDILNRQRKLLEELQSKSNPQPSYRTSGVNTAAYTTPPAPAAAPAFGNDNTFLSDLDKYIANDPGLSAILNPERPAVPQPQRPVTLEKIRQDFLERENQPPLQPGTFGQQPAAQPERQQYIPPQPVTQRQTEQEPCIPLREQMTRMTGSRTTSSAELSITEKQLKALSRKHLLMMISDLQGEIIRIKEENENITAAYHAGTAQKARTG